MQKGQNVTFQTLKKRPFEQLNQIHLLTVDKISLKKLHATKVIEAKTLLKRFREIGT